MAMRTEQECAVFNRILEIVRTDPTMSDAGRSEVEALLTSLATQDWQSLDPVQQFEVAQGLRRQTKIG